MSETTPSAESSSRTPEQIQAEMEAIRLQMTQTVDQLVAEVQPARIAEKTTAAAKQKAASLLDRAKEIASLARQGDPEALRQVGYAVAGVAAVIGVAVLRSVRRHRR